ncbi:MAG: 6-pyruvoyl tetrahydropterin synthase family protein [Candidatus Thorarchaeota archaeon]
MKLRISGDKLTIASAHMLTRHDKCARLHGHNYQIEVEIEGELDESNMIIDFGVFKSKVGEKLAKFDHKILLPQRSEDLDFEIDEKQVIITTCDGRRYRFPKEDVVLLPLESTTVELLSKYIHDLIKEEYPQFKITIEIAETPTCKVIFSGN